MDGSLHRSSSLTLTLFPLFSFYSISQTGDAIVGITPLYHAHYCVHYNPQMKQEELLFCEPDKDEFAIVLGWCMLISVPFMIATILVYRFVALKNLHGKCFTA